jgi:hypothetical protein
MSSKSSLEYRVSMPVSRALLVYRGFEIDLCSCDASLGGFVRIARCRCMRRITRLQKIEWKTRCGLIGASIVNT